jgi:hypothetical protein
LKLERSIGNLAKKLDRLDPVFSSSNKTGLRYWKSKPIIPLDEWIKFRDAPYALNYFPDDFDQVLTHIPEDESGRHGEDVKKWDSDYLELMEYTKNADYGKVKCFQCLLSPAGDDPIFIGINKLVSKGLIDRKQDPVRYPCEVVNRFQCPYEITNVKRDDHLGDANSNFEVEDLFRVERMAFAVEIALAKARKEDSRIRVRDKEELLHALTDKEILTKILEQGAEAPEVSEYIRTYLSENQDYILDYFTHMKDNVNLEELRFY